MLVTPDDKVQEAGQVALSDAVLGILGVRHSILVQHKQIEPGCQRAVWAVCRPRPTLTSDIDICH